MLLLSSLLALSSAKLLFSENFNSPDWESTWVQSKAKSDFGKFKQTAGKWYADASNLGLQTSQDAKFYALSRKFDEFTNKDKEIAVSIVVKHEQTIDCGGGYIKLLPASTDIENFSGDSKYNIMFGPDICGPPTKKVHLIFNYKGENLLWKKEPAALNDGLSHLYTFVLKSDNTYKVLVDNKEVGAGTLEADWDFLEPKEIPDPAAKKPADWVDAKQIADPSDVKPADWDDQPKEIVDPEATKPDDWDDSLDGEWEAPLIDNPKYKGEWKAKMIPNPEYKGEWIHPKIANPDYVEDANLYAYDSFAAVAIDIWQVKSGTIFDDFQIWDSETEAAEWATSVFLPNQQKEKEMHDRIEAERREKEEEERKKREAESAADDHDDHDHAGHDHDEL